MNWQLVRLKISQILIFIWDFLCLFQTFIGKSPYKKGKYVFKLIKFMYKYSLKKIVCYLNF